MKPDFIPFIPKEGLIKLRQIEPFDHGKVQSDWNELDSNDPSYILNKPDLTDPVDQVQSDWNENDILKPGFILNKPDIPDCSEQIQSDWEQHDSDAVDFIKNKPDVFGGEPGADGRSSFVYIAYAADAGGTGFTNTFNSALNYIAILSSNTELVSPAVTDFAGLWKNYKGADGTNGIDGADGIGIPGADGTDGTSKFIYIAYGSDGIGTGFTNIFDSALNYIAILLNDTELVSPVVANFAGLWKNYKGADGAPGTNGTNGVGTNGINGTNGADDLSMDVYIDFLSVTAFVYNCPYAMKFTSQISEGTGATLSVALNTNMTQFQKLTVTPTQIGLIILKGTLL